MAQIDQSATAVAKEVRAQATLPDDNVDASDAMEMIRSRFPTPQEFLAWLDRVDALVAKFGVPTR